MVLHILATKSFPMKVEGLIFYVHTYIHAYTRTVDSLSSSLLAYKAYVLLRLSLPFSLLFIVCHVGCGGDCQGDVPDCYNSCISDPVAPGGDVYAGAIRRERERPQIDLLIHIKAAPPYHLTLCTFFYHRLPVSPSLFFCLTLPPSLPPLHAFYLPIYVYIGTLAVLNCQFNITDSAKCRGMKTLWEMGTWPTGQAEWSRFLNYR